MNYTVADMMVVSLAREIRDGETLFHGVSSPIPMVAILLACSSQANNATYLNIAGGVNARPQQLSTSTDGPNMLDNSACLFNLTDIFDLSARGKLDTAFLSGVQVDKWGNLNSSAIGEFAYPKVRLPGGAGSAVILPTAKRVIVWRTKHNTKSFVEKVDFVTSQGNLAVVVTPYCIFKKRDNMLVLESIHPYSSLAEVEKNTGFAIQGNCTAITLPPTEEELKLLQQIDPARIREIELV